LANTVQGLGHFVREFPPDLIVVHGDRVETLAGAIVGALNNTLVAHIEGGEISGTVDELIRHAVTKLSHLHFVANEDARARLLQMGETGGDVILEAIRELQEDARFRVLPSMRFEYFLTLLKHAQALVGNSSSGVREAPVYGVPSVNIGTRQLNRYSYPSIVDVPEEVG